MKPIFYVLLALTALAAIPIAILFSFSPQAKNVDMQERNLHFQLKKPLLIMTGPKGFLACGYIDVETCNKTGEACAIVTGVDNYDEMKAAKIVGVSQAAAELGIMPGMDGAAALAMLGGK
jgi:uncharacterized protein YunC (DUF1805 family)